jgi:ubiquinone/menaquinone biosynthesis methyltransferase
MQKDKIFFGFKEIKRAEKTGLVKEIFSAVAKKYDLMNDLMSAGIHRCWKNEMVKKINFAGYQKANYKKASYQKEDEEICRIIDVAGGTGDIAFRIAKKFRAQNIKFKIDVADINQEMLDVGKARAVDLNLFSDLNFTCCDGEKLCFKNETFDFFTIAFGIRNFTNIDLALSQAYKVLKPGGEFICLEFSQVNGYLLQKIYDAYSFKIIPKIGEIILKDRNSYQYLVESIRKFPPQDEFKKMIANAGFKNAAYENLSLGIVTIYSAVK